MFELCNEKVPWPRAASAARGSSPRKDEMGRIGDPYSPALWGPPARPLQCSPRSAWGPPSVLQPTSPPRSATRSPPRSTSPSPPLPIPSTPLRIVEVFDRPVKLRSQCELSSRLIRTLEAGTRLRVVETHVLPNKGSERLCVAAVDGDKPLGWVTARKSRLGDYLLRDVDSEGLRSLRIPHNHCSSDRLRPKPRSLPTSPEERTPTSPDSLLHGPALPWLDSHRSLSESHRSAASSYRPVDYPADNSAEGVEGGGYSTRAKVTRPKPSLLGPRPRKKGAGGGRSSSALPPSEPATEGKLRAGFNWRAATQQVLSAIDESSVDESGGPKKARDSPQLLDLVKSAVKHRSRFSTHSLDIKSLPPASEVDGVADVLLEKANAIDLTLT